MIERNEMKALLQSGESVYYYETRSKTDIECRISAIITRYDEKNREFEITLELEEVKEGVSCRIVTTPKYVRRKEIL